MLQILWTLIGQGIHQIDVECVKSLRSLLHSSHGLSPIVHPPDRFEMPVIETLHTDGKSCDAGHFVSVKPVFFKSTRIGLERDFAVGHQGQTGAQITDQTRNARRRKQTRRATTDKNAAHRSAPHQGQAALYISA